MHAIATSGLLVARDLEIVAWLDRLAGASVAQIRRRFELGRTQGYRRLQVLQDHGLIRRRHLTATRPPLYTVAGRALRLASCEHGLALSDLVVAIETAGGEVASERELRRGRTNGSGPGRLTDQQLATVRGCRRIPDAAELLAGGGLRAYEVELSSKGRARRASVLAAYAASTYEQVNWIVPDLRLAALVRHEIEETGLSGFQEVCDGNEPQR